MKTKICEACRGDGFARPPTGEPCPHCRGYGIVDENGDRLPQRIAAQVEAQNREALRAAFGWEV